MPNIKSAIKRVNINKSKALKNVMRKSALKTSVKKCKAAIASGVDTDKVFSSTVSAIDKAAAKKLIHKNTASRKKSRLAKAMNKAAQAGG
ncbi:MAG: 30S ribosomal protein S20 [Oscillospiraceae bacterium]|nr:30S ribosomal protein S20 [Oscillospiraceae bacterium]